MNWIRICVAFFIFVLASPVYAGNYEDGVAAYEKGDYTTAAREFRKAAEQGHTKAQYQLGILYDKGKGVPQNYIQAHLWFNLAAAQGNKDAKKRRDLIAEKMTPTQIARAQEVAWQWFAKKELSRNLKKKKSELEEAKLKENSELESKMRDYLAVIYNVIQANWEMPPASQIKKKGVLEALYVIEIAPSGQIRRAWFERRSGDKFFDQSTEKAVARSVLPRLPDLYKGRSFEVGLRFTPSGMKSN